MNGKIDLRRISQGRLILAESYVDQPYIVQTDDGAWLCCVTTAPGEEGSRGQRVITMRSSDQGRIWSAPSMVEPPGSPENSYAVMLKAPSGRIYIFYNFNTHNVRTVDRHDGKPPFERVDSLGDFVFKHSDDHGRSWSARRQPIPVREFACDRDNIYGGALRLFWNVGKPFIHRRAAFVPLHKVGQMGEGFFAQSEGALLRSPNLLVERDPAKIAWETLPDGEVGLLAPAGGGPISEEQSYVALSDGSLYVTYRTVAGYAGESYSRDDGHTWSPPRWRCYADGRPMKHPRAATVVWKCRNGNYLLWFHNHGGRFLGNHPDRLNIGYNDRNPAWLCGGVEVDSPSGRILRWSQPEIVLYSEDPKVRISYPDLVEENGDYFISETEKRLARVHPLDATLLEGMWRSAAKMPEEGAIAASAADTVDPRPEAVLLGEECRALAGRDEEGEGRGEADLQTGFTLDAWIQLRTLAAGQVLIGNGPPSGQGVALQTTDRGTIEVVLRDGRVEDRWDCDPGLLRAHQMHHVAVIVDDGPKLIMFVVDGRLCDGGDHRQFGWGRFRSSLQEACPSPEWHVGPEVEAWRMHPHPLRIHEAAARTACAPALATRGGR